MSERDHYIVCLKCNHKQVAMPMQRTSPCLNCGRTSEMDCYIVARSPSIKS